MHHFIHLQRKRQLICIIHVSNERIQFIVTRIRMLSTVGACVCPIVRNVYVRRLTVSNLWF